MITTIPIMDKKNIFAHMDVNLIQKWDMLTSTLEEKFDMDANLEAILMLVGIQELGRIPDSLSKDQKLDVMHVAICTLLEDYGFYNYKGEDEDGWPHWDREKKIPNLKGEEQDVLIKTALIGYFENKLN